MKFYSLWFLRVLDGNNDMATTIIGTPVLLFFLVLFKQLF